ncbi:fibrinogen-like protein A isoform X2 [Clavelina lepadiformis]|uniref:fibrinogen-like protein A isoform X2 n=1 Tax=Clavelina lepadiformis TaxID=159417 RepID=UPI0040437CFB
MKGSFLLLLLVYYVTMTYSQRCRQSVRTICDDDTTFTWTRKLDKSDVACPEDGEMNEDEENDNQTACCNLEPLRTDIVTRLTKIEELLTPPNTTTMATSTTTVTTTTTSSITSCSTSLSNGPHTLTSGIEVYCEDGWTVFQRRIDGSVNFSRRWDDYANGFGQINGEFWLGLDNIHEMTRGGGCRLKIELWDFHGNQRHADYSSFSIESAENLYRLRVSGYSGNAGDSLSYHNGYPFSTEDNDNDSSSGLNCATGYGGSQGWWFGSCAHSYLNGVWMCQSSGYAHGITWYHWKGYNEPLKETKMKLRCD